MKKTRHYSFNFARLNELLEQTKTSVNALGVVLGVKNVGSINRWRSGQCAPSGEAMAVLCEYFNVSPAEFFLIDGTRYDEVMRSKEAEKLGLPQETNSQIFTLAEGLDALRRRQNADAKRMDAVADALHEHMKKIEDSIAVIRAMSQIDEAEQTRIRMQVEREYTERMKEYEIKLRGYKQLVSELEAERNQQVKHSMKPYPDDTDEMPPLATCEDQRPELEKPGKLENPMELGKPGERGINLG